MSPSFALSDLAGDSLSFPTGRAALLAFVKEDCPTCDLTLPLIEAARRAFGDAVDVWAVGQEADGNAVLAQRHSLTTPVLDDSALKVSFAFGIETVPTLILAGADGSEDRRLEGFDRVQWRDLFAALAIAAGAAAEVDWEAYPEMRPGCGSKSVEPGIAERLAAEAKDSPLRARRIEIGRLDDEHEFMFDQGFTDGLPVVPPTPERVLRMLQGTRRDAQEVVAIVPPNMAPCTVEKAAINAVMAGCRPEFLPVVLTAIEACCSDEFNAHGVMATTMGASPALIVNGPIRQRIGMNMKLGVFGQGNRANASIGRALRLVLRNVGGARPGGTERSTLGSPIKYTLAFAEWEERSPWEPYHVERGFRPEDSVVTAIAVTAGPSLIVDQTTREARAMAGSIGAAMASAGHPKAGAGDTLLAVCPEHVDTLWSGRMTKAQLREQIVKVTTRPLRDLLATDDVGGGPRRAAASEGQLDQPVPKWRSPANIHVVVCGADAGKFSAYFAGWAGGPVGSTPVSRKIEEA